MAKVVLRVLRSIVALVVVGVFTLNALPANVGAASASTYKITIVSSAGAKARDSHNKPVLSPTQQHGRHTFSFDASLSGRTAALPQDTLVFLRFPRGKVTVSTSPAKGVLEVPKEKYHLPLGVAGLLRVVKEGPATVTVSQNSTTPGMLSASNTAVHWSGYARTDSSGSFNQVASYWTVPVVTCGAGPTESVAWIGIDGANNNSLIQTGTASSCDENNVAHYYAWWEILPAPLTQLSCTVSPGNYMAAEIKEVSSNSYKITLKNVTTGTDCSPPTQAYSGPGSSIEWILERPLLYDQQSDTWQPSPLADYGSVSFTNNLQNGGIPGHDFATDSLEMTSDGTVAGTILSSPSAPNTTGDTFTTVYCGSGCPDVNVPAWSNVTPSSVGHEEIRALDVSPSAIWAAGWEQPPSGGKVGVTYRYASGQWTKFSPPTVTASNHWLYGIAADNNGDVWAVGNYTASKAQTLAYRWIGFTWAWVPSDNPGGTKNVHGLKSVAIDSTGTPWAVGQWNPGMLPLLEKWNGAKFTYQPLSLPSGHTTATLNDIDFSSTGTGWAVGSGSSGTPGPVFYHYDGTSWIPSGGSVANGSLESISVLSNDEAWAVGSKRIDSYTVAPLIMRYINGSWSEVPGLTGYPAETALWGIEANNPSDIWAVGKYAVNGKTKPFTMHYDGANWVQAQSPSATNDNTSLFGVTMADGDAWAGGSTNTTSVMNNAYPYLMRSSW